MSNNNVEQIWKNENIKCNIELIPRLFDADQKPLCSARSCII